MQSIFDHWNWQPPSHWTRIKTVEMHTGGEPLRIFTSGLPPIEGDTVLEKRRYFRETHDHLRTAMLWEPRGHTDMYGAILTPSRDADFDVFFLHNEGYSTMCGHAIIALTTLAVETGLLRRDVRQCDGSVIEMTFNVPAGRIAARALVEGRRARNVSFQNVPAFVYLRDQQVDVPGLGRCLFDVAYGGAFYAVLDAPKLGLQLTPRYSQRLVDAGRRIKEAVMNNFVMEHPYEKDLGFLYGTIFTGPAEQPGHHSRNVCIFADGELDRSATGSGVSARAAIHYARGELRINEVIQIESILGSTMTVEVLETTRFGPYDGVIPRVGGAAFITGAAEFYIDPDDPLSRGFILR